MSPTAAAIVTSLASGYFVNFTAPKLKAFFEKAIALDPSIEQDLEAAETPEDFEKVFEEATGVIDAAAGDGQIEVDGTLLQAMRGIRFDHENGLVTIGETTMEAPYLQTGGKGKGKTHIGGGTNMKSSGTQIKVGKGCSITMTGDAQISQS